MLHLIVDLFVWTMCLCLFFAGWLAGWPCSFMLFLCGVSYALSSGGDNADAEPQFSLFFFTSIYLTLVPSRERGRHNSLGN